MHAGEICFDILCYMENPQRIVSSVVVWSEMPEVGGRHDITGMEICIRSADSYSDKFALEADAVDQGMHCLAEAFDVIFVVGEVLVFFG